MADPTEPTQTVTAGNVEVSEGLDDRHRGVKLGIDGEPFWRTWLTPQGDILVGSGFVPPVPLSSGGATEVYDSTSVPASPTFPYIRVSRDVDGDPQTIYFGSVT